MTTTELTEEERAFEDALAESERKKQEEQDRKDGKFTPRPPDELGELPYLVIDEKKPLVLRVIGLPASHRKNPWEPKKLFVTQWLDDTKRNHLKIIWPQKLTSDGRETGDLDETCLLKEFYDELFKKEWKEYKEPVNNKKGEYHFFNENTQSFQRLHVNKAFEKQKFPPSANPFFGEEYAMNVICRNDERCEREKKTLLLTSFFLEKEWKDKKENVHTTIYYNPGVGKIFYDKLLKTIVDIHGHWNLDIVVTKKKIADNKTEWVIFDSLSSEIANQYPQVIPFLKKPDSFKERTVYRDGKGYQIQVAMMQKLTPEEESYTKIDLDKEFKPTSIRKIYENLKGLFASWDREGNKKGVWTDRLMAELREEDLRTGYVEGNPKSEVVTEAGAVAASKGEIHFENGKQIDSLSPKPRPRPSTSSIDFKEIYPHFDELSENNKNVLRERVIEVNGKMPIYKDAEVDVYACACLRKWEGTNEQISFPEAVNQCGVCLKNLS